MKKNQDGLIIARKNELRILRSLQRFGWLRTRDIAAMSWTTWAEKVIQELDISPLAATASSIRMAQRTLKRLKQKSNVISAHAPDGSIIYALSESGARRLRELGMSAYSGKDLVHRFSSAFFLHRCIANEIAISALIQGFRISTDREISQGAWVGGKMGVLGKRPDVVIRNNEKLIFVEVERSRRNAKDHAFLIAWLIRISAAIHQGSALCSDERAQLQKVFFICTKSFQVRIQGELEAQGLTREQQNQFIAFSTTLYSFRYVLFS